MGFVVAAFALAVGPAVALGVLAAPYGPKIGAVDVVFCVLTFTNCTPYTRFSDPMDWPTLLMINAVVFGVWSLYALSARACVVGQASWVRVLGGFLAVLIPLGMGILGLAVILLQGIRH